MYRLRSLMMVINTLNAELNPIFNLLALLGAHHILHVGRIRVKGNIEGKIVGTGRRRRRNCLLKHVINPLKAELNPIRHLLALLGAHHILHVGRIRVKDRNM